MLSVLLVSQHALKKTAEQWETAQQIEENKAQRVAFQAVSGISGDFIELAPISDQPLHHRLANFRNPQAPEAGLPQVGQGGSVALVIPFELTAKIW